MLCQNMWSKFKITEAEILAVESTDDELNGQFSSRRSGSKTRIASGQQSRIDFHNDKVVPTVHRNNGTGSMSKSNSVKCLDLTSIKEDGVTPLATSKDLKIDPNAYLMKNEVKL